MTMTSNHEEQNTEASYEVFETFLNTRSNEELSPHIMHAQISSHYYDQARQGILSVLRDGVRYGTLGFSSGSMRHHMIYRANNGNIFVIHNAYGNINDAYYFTPEMLNDFFEGSENEMPEFKLSDDVKVILQRLDRGTFGDDEFLPPTVRSESRG